MIFSTVCFVQYLVCVCVRVCGCVCVCACVCVCKYYSLGLLRSLEPTKRFRLQRIINHSSPHPGLFFHPIFLTLLSFPPSPPPPLLPVRELCLRQLIPASSPFSLSPLFACFTPIPYRLSSPLTFLFLLIPRFAPHQLFLLVGLKGRLTY